MSPKIKKAFDGVVADEKLKQQTMQMVSQKIRSQKKAPFGNWRQLKVQVVMGLVALMTLGGFFAYQTPVSAVSIDSGYSVELRVNWFNRVVEVVGFDAGGKALAANLSVTHMNYEEAMTEILEVAEAEDVYVTVASRQASRANKMMANLESHQGMMRQHMTLYQSSEELMEEAQDEGVSLGRMRAMMEFHGFDEEATIENSENLSTDELIEAVESHRKEMQQQMDGNDSSPGSIKDHMMNKPSRNNSKTNSN